MRHGVRMSMHHAIRCEDGSCSGVSNRHNFCRTGAREWAQIYLQTKTITHNCNARRCFGGHRHAQMLQIRPKWKAAKIKEIVQYEYIGALKMHAVGSVPNYGVQLPAVRPRHPQPSRGKPTLEFHCEVRELLPFAPSH